MSTLYLYQRIYIACYVWKLFTFFNRIAPKNFHWNKQIYFSRENFLNKAFFRFPFSSAVQFLVASMLLQLSFYSNKYLKKKLHWNGYISRLEKRQFWDEICWGKFHLTIFLIYFAIFLKKSKTALKFCIHFLKWTDSKQEC